MTRVWYVEFANNYDSLKVVGRTAEEAIKRARSRTSIPKKYQWVSEVRLVAEAE